MRVTIDRDKNTLIDFLVTVLKGYWYLHRLPDTVKKSSSGRGYHYVWFDAAKNFEHSLELRKKIGDDENRIAHDIKKRKSFKQVLFDKKVIEYVG
jgi:hypothetical protein